MIRWRFDWTWGSASETSWVDVTWQVSAGLDGATPVRRVALEVAPRTLDPIVYALTPDGQTVGSGRLYRVDGDDDRTVLVAAGAWRDVRAERGRVLLQLSDEVATDDDRPFPGPMTLRRTETYTGGAELFFGERPTDDGGADLPIVASRAEVVDAGKRWPEAVFTVVYAKTKAVWGPIVYGAPGSATQPGSPAYLIDEATVVDDGVTCWRVLIARHRVAATTVLLWTRPLAGGEVTLTGHGEDDAGSYTVHHATDSEGVTYAYVRIPVPDTDLGANPDLDGAIPTQEDEMRVSWTGGDALPGGAGTLVAMLLEQSAVRCDLPAWRAVASELDRYVLAGYIDAQVSPADYARRILSALPVSMVHTARGLAPVIHPWSLDYPDGEVWIAPDTAAEVLVPDRTVLAVTVAYAHPPRASEPGATVTRTTADSAILVAAQSYGYPRGEAVMVEAPFVWSSATASLLADQYLRCRMPGPRLTYAVDPTRYGPGGEREFVAGQCIRLTDSALGVSSRLAVVTAIEVSGSEMRMDLELSPDLTGQR